MSAFWFAEGVVEPVERPPPLFLFPDIKPRYLEIIPRQSRLAFCRLVAQLPPVDEETVASLRAQWRDAAKGAALWEGEQRTVCAEAARAYWRSPAGQARRRKVREHKLERITAQKIHARAMVLGVQQEK